MVSNATNNKNKSKTTPKNKGSPQERINYAEEFKSDHKFKTELCNSYSANKFCKYGNRCRFAHGKKELFDKSLTLPKYKQAECISFYTTGYCNYGQRCHFKHDTRKLDEVPRSWHSFNLLMGELKESRLDVFNGINKSKKVVNLNIAEDKVSLFLNYIGLNMNQVTYIYMSLLMLLKDHTLGRS
jgi:hypothetical protein